MSSSGILGCKEKRISTFTEVAAYWKKGNNPEDQSERSLFNPSG
jgi:hypothetical protein